MTSHRFIHGLGLLLAAVGVVVAAWPFADASAPHIARAAMLAIGLTIGCASVLVGGDRDRPADGIIAVSCLVLGLSALWPFLIESGAAPSFGRSLFALFGCLAVLTVTWRVWGAGLGVAGILAILHAATWQSAGFGISIDLVRDIADILWLGLDEGAVGWVLESASSTVLPFVLLGSLLADRTFIGRPSGPIGAVRAVCRFLIPPLAVGSLIATERPGLELATVIPAWLLPIGLGLAWFRLVPVHAVRGGQSEAPGWRDLVMIGGAMAALASALFGGASLSAAAILALAAAIALSAVDPEIRRRPTIILENLAESGVVFGKLLLAAAAVGMVLAALDRSGLPFDLAWLLAGGLGEARLPLLLLAAIIAGGFGLVMPGFAAYLIAAALLGPALRTVGVDTLTMHLLVLSMSALTSAVVAGQAASDAGARRFRLAASWGKAASR